MLNNPKLNDKKALLAASAIGLKMALHHAK
jgi:hypothetical protein